MLGLCTGFAHLAIYRTPILMGNLPYFYHLIFPGWFASNKNHIPYSFLNDKYKIVSFWLRIDIFLKKNVAPNISIRIYNSIHNQRFSFWNNVLCCHKQFVWVLCSKNEPTRKFTWLLIATHQLCMRTGTLHINIRQHFQSQHEGAVKKKTGHVILFVNLIHSILLIINDMHYH